MTRAVLGKISHMRYIGGLLDVEQNAAKQRVYLITMSHVLPGTVQSADLADMSQVTREQVANAVRDCLINPAAVGFGRPSDRDESLVEKLVVFRELHESGQPHFHVAVKLQNPVRFRGPKTALRERYHMPSHWSCTHTQWYSAVRYGCMASERKPAVDATPHQWTPSGEPLNLFEEAQEPYCAPMWKRRREQHDAIAIRDEKTLRFRKFDLTSLIISDSLFTPAAIKAYAQDHGTVAMQAFVDQHARRLKDYIEDAKQWARAREDVALERETDWALLLRVADRVCEHGVACTYALAVADFFQQNAGSFTQRQLAKALRDVILTGPSKTTRVPMLVGPTNTGKSTVVKPFDDLFGFHAVFHKPALHSKYGLRNVSHGKRFIYWDDYRPVEYALSVGGKDTTVPVSTFLSLFQGEPFEIAVSQSFQDGNEDVQWQRGAVMTAKEEGLWTPAGNVTAEDIRHMQSRVLLFRAAAKVTAMRSTQPCPVHLAQWIRDFSTESQSAPSRALGASAAGALDGFAALMQAARLPAETAAALLPDIIATGAVSVSELLLGDWQGLPSWPRLRPLEQRRLLGSLGVGV